MTLLSRFLAALALTLVVEVPLLFLSLHILRQEKGFLWTLLVGVLANALTLPLLWFVLPSLITPWMALVILGEALVAVVEAAIYRIGLGMTSAEALFVSLFCNICSIAAGLLVFGLW